MHKEGSHNDMIDTTKNRKACVQYIRKKISENEFTHINSRVPVQENCLGYIQAFYMLDFITKEDLEFLQEKLERYLWYAAEI